jgi:hypothetical protein
VLGVPLPMGPGAACVAPFRLDALRFGTFVVLDTTRGAVPVTTVDVNCPLTLRLVPVAAPIFGVVKTMLVAAMPLGNVVLSDGTPPELVTSTELFPLASAAHVPPVAYIRSLLTGASPAGVLLPFDTTMLNDAGHVTLRGAGQAMVPR